MQTSYVDYLVQSVEGGLADSGFSDITSRAMGANVAQVDAVTVDTAVDSTAYSFTVNGLTVTFTSGVGTTVALIQAGLLAAAQSISYLAGVVTFSGASPNIVATADNPGIPFTIAEADANLSLAKTTANVTASPIPFGRCMAEIGPGKAVIPTATGFLFGGVSVMKHKSRLNASGLAQYEDGETVPMMRKGRIWVIPEQIVSAITDSVFARHTANGVVDVPGRFRIDADSNRADQLSNVRWLTTTTTVGQLATIEINLP